MYSYSLGVPLKSEVLIPEPFFDEKTKLLFESRGIPLNVKMKDYYSFVNAMVTMGIAFPNASGRSARPKIRDCFNNEEQFYVKDYHLSELTYQEMMDTLPAFLAFINFMKYVDFLKSLKDRGLSIQDTVATTEISYVNNTIHLFNLMRGITSGKIAIETPNGTVCLDTLKTDEAVVEPLRNKVDDATELFAATKSHIDTIRKEYITKEAKLQEDMRKRLQSIRLTGFRESYKVMKELVDAGFVLTQEGEYILLKWTGKQHVTRLTLPLRCFVDDDSKNPQNITIPIPEEISKKLYVTELVLIVDNKMRIMSGQGKGKHPHLSGGSFCIGDVVGKDIISAPSVIYSISTANMNSFGGGSGRQELTDYADQLRKAIVEKDLVKLKESGLLQVIGDATKGTDFGTVFGTNRKEELW